MDVNNIIIAPLLEMFPLFGKKTRHGRSSPSSRSTQTQARASTYRLVLSPCFKERCSGESGLYMMAHAVGSVEKSNMAYILTPSISIGFLRTHDDDCPSLGPHCEIYEASTVIRSFCCFTILHTRPYITPFCAPVAKNKLYKFPVVTVCMSHRSGCGYSDNSTEACVTSALKFSYASYMYETVNAVGSEVGNLAPRVVSPIMSRQRTRICISNSRILHSFLLNRLVASNTKHPFALNYRNYIDSLLSKKDERRVR